MARWAAMVAFAEGDYPRAVEQAGTALEGYSDHGTRRAPAVGQMACLLGAALAAEGRKSEARERLEDGCPQLEGWGLADPLIVTWGRSARMSLSRGR